LQHDNLEQSDAISTDTAADTAVLEPITVQKLLADFPDNPYAKAAVVLASMGIPVVHLLLGEKISHARLGAATLDLNTIYARAKVVRNAGAFAYTDGDLSLLDIDGIEAKTKIEAETGIKLDSIDTFSVTTPNGGWHYYFIKDDELRALGNVEVSYGTHIGFELRQNNMYVVAPFSVLPDGRTWSILKARPQGKMPPKLREWIQAQQKRTAPKTTKTAAAKTPPVTGSTDIERQEHFEAWLTANHVDFEPATWDAKENRWEYIVTTRCPWEHVHGEKNDDKDFALYLYDDGKLGAKCVHQSCQNEWTLPNESCWKNFKALLESKNGHITMYPSPQATVGAAAGSQIVTPTTKVISAAAVWGDDPKRAEKLAALRSGRMKVLVNCQVLTEGFDMWQIACVVFARPTKSKIFFTQAAGRGTRLQDGTGNLIEALGNGLDVKRACLIIDMVDNTKRHKLVNAKVQASSTTWASQRSVTTIATGIKHGMVMWRAKIANPPSLGQRSRTTQKRQPDFSELFAR